MVHLEPNAHRCACKAPIAVALQDGRARPLPDPTIPATGSVVLPVAWASHLAITDEAGDRFLYDQLDNEGPPKDK